MEAVFDFMKDYERQHGKFGEPPSPHYINERWFSADDSNIQ